MLDGRGKKRSNHRQMARGPKGTEFPTPPLTEGIWQPFRPSKSAVLASLYLFLSWLWVKNGYPKWNPGKWNQGLKPAVKWCFNFEPYPVGTPMCPPVFGWVQGQTHGNGPLWRPLRNHRGAAPRHSRRRTGYRPAPGPPERVGPIYLTKRYHG